MGTSQDLPVQTPTRIFAFLDNIHFHHPGDVRDDSLEEFLRHFDQQK
jgi:hypothetical protein